MHFFMLALFFAVAVAAASAEQPASPVQADQASRRVSSVGLAEESDIDMEDHVSLLQAEVVVKAKSGTPVDLPRATKQDMCDGSCPSPSVWFGDAEEELASKDQAGRGPNANAAQPEGTALLSRSTFACVLEVIILIIALDGFRRWEEKKRPKSVPTPSKACGVDKNAWKDLMQAALAGDKTRCLKLLADTRTPISGEDAWGCTALHAAAKGGVLDVVAALLERGACVHDRDAWDETPLHFAARAGQSDICELLLAYGAQVNAVNADDRTPLVSAAEAGKEAACKLLLGRGGGAGDLDDSDLPPLLSTLLMLNVISQGSGGEDIAPGGSIAEDQSEDWNY